ncbi:hypothetical protein [Bradyrhizobium sp. BR 1432]|uniref:hypothetical protein n=1 Tax=Bradyrhizobium sp. BR 1432 TaxID=3447966 RepID=UPI003EE44968
MVIPEMTKAGWATSVPADQRDLDPLFCLSNAPFVVGGQLQQALLDERVSLRCKFLHGPHPLSTELVVHRAP